MFKGNKYSVISKTYISLVFCFLLLATSNVRMSEGTFCRVEVHIEFILSLKMHAIHKKVQVGKDHNIDINNHNFFV